MNRTVISDDRCHLTVDFTCFNQTHTAAYDVLGVYEQHSKSSITGTESWSFRVRGGPTGSLQTCSSKVAVTGTRIQ